MRNNLPKVSHLLGGRAHAPFPQGTAAPKSKDEQTMTLGAEETTFYTQRA